MRKSYWWPLLKLMRHLTIILALAAIPILAGEKVMGGLYKASVENVGPWEVARYSRDAAGKQTEYCVALVITDSEQAIRVQAGKGPILWGFMGEASSAVGPSPTVSYWFNDRKSEQKTVKMKLLKAPEDEAEFLTYSQPGDMEAYRTSTKVTFSYSWEGKAVRQSFVLKGASAALKKLFATCPQ